jgi:hypothetical protein
MIIFKKWKNNKNKQKQKVLEISRGENDDANSTINNICIHVIIAVNKYSYYSLSTYKIMSVLNDYLNLYVRLNNIIITIYKLK